jgi:peptidoglycan/xylan/chitin deacetylase (PgdA/CDA1 family)
MIGVLRGGVSLPQTAISHAAISHAGMTWVVATLIACGGEASSFEPHAFEMRRAALSGDLSRLTVSLTFDDTLKPQAQAAALLAAHGLFGTFYVNSPRLHEGSGRAGSPYLSIADALELQTQGHEIGGHTLSHLRLIALSDAERQREIINDRRQLARLGFAASSFAYPGGDLESNLDPDAAPTLGRLLREAGYASARDTNGFALDGCASGAESLPPVDAYRLRSVRSVNDAPPVPSGQAPVPPDTAATLLSWMDHAARCGGGYLPLVFHHVLPDCSAPDAPGSYCFELAQLELLASELERGQRCLLEDGETRCYSVSVATVSEALGDTEPRPLASEAYTLRNASLERTLASGSTECLQRTQASPGSASFGRSTEHARGGRASEYIQIADPYRAPAELRVARDFGACAIFASEGSAYQLSLHYRATPETALPTLRSVVYRLTHAYVWEPWMLGEPFAAESAGQWVRHAVVTAPVPAQTIALSFGLRQQSAGAVFVDDWAIGPAPPAGP